MTNTNHTHTIRLVIRLADVLTKPVADVAAGAIEPLVGPTFTRFCEIDKKGRIAVLEIDHYGLNDNEAKRTALVARSAILPLVTGATVWSKPIGNLRAGRPVAKGRTEVRSA
jgi:hypothetical protein